MEGRRIEINFIHIFVMMMVFQGSRTRHVANVCLKGNTEGDALNLTCRVDALTSEVVIIGPNDKTFGKCFPPIRQHNNSDCSGNTTQDLTTNTTTLFLNETDTSMSGVWRCKHGTKTGEDWLNITIPPFCKAYQEPEGSRTMHVANVCLKGNTEGDALIMTCRVDTLTSEVVIIGPNDKTFGKCFPPFREDKQSDCSGNTTQDLTTNTTTLFLNETNKSMSGVWRCTHGNKTGEDWLNITIPPFCKACQEPEDCNYNACCTILIVTMVMIVIVVFIYYAHKKSLLSACCNRILGRHEQTSDEKRPLIPGDHNHDNKLPSKCCKCKHISSYAFCTDCSEFFCEICCKRHVETNPNHGVNEITLVENSNECGKCKICKRKSPVRACKKCKTALCNSCHCRRKHSETEANVAKFRNNPQRSIKKSNPETAGEPITSRLDRAYDIPIPNHEFERTIRICGLAILHNKNVVVVDRNNKNIMSFANGKKNATYDLDDEPRGMTGVCDNKFAVTFPDEKIIGLYVIEDSTISLEKTFPVLSIGKPFSISFNSDYYAVEIGEDEDGMIVILDNNGKEIKRILNTLGYGYFTGHTIRLCLDYCRKRVYVSAMSKKEISSINFDSSANWHIDVPSPRGMVLIPGSDMNLILASRRGNTIYQINSEDGSKTILKNDGEISGPRYIAYESIAKLLCVQLDGCVIRIYKYSPMQEEGIEMEDVV